MLFKLLNLEFPGPFARTINANRVRLIALDIGSRQCSVENVVCRKMKEWNTVALRFLGQLMGTVSVYAICRLDLFLRGI